MVNLIAVIVVSSTPNGVHYCNLRDEPLFNPVYANVILRYLPALAFGPWGCGNWSMRLWGLRPVTSGQLGGTPYCYQESRMVTPAELVNQANLIVYIVNW
ncbi:hypothetical protein HS088_TW23G00979 [Tripterygium wilfordii]|uniref:Uncharacterized protein n=1 Tax=Tripterygium wilfordii TaxID=458696 RepID=A0A7J7BX85_TRIWF|nr:hypothetical protein HS088_TW23G00979 [Tripterygium wilfordii]